jgi:hypothetical protein
MPESRANALGAPRCSGTVDRDEARGLRTGVSASAHNLGRLSGFVTTLLAMAPTFVPSAAPAKSHAHIPRPACKGEPVADHFSLYGNGTAKRAGIRLMVSVGVTGQQGDVHLSHMIELVNEILSGKVR